MTWDSRVFRSFITDTLAGTAVFDLDSPADTYKMSAFNDSVTPDKDATSAASKYGAGGTWTTGNEVIDTLNTNWVAGGRTVSGLAISNPSSGTIMIDCDDVAGAGNVTMTGFYGTLTYDDTKSTPVADQAICFNSLGGAQTITNGPITIVIDTAGLLYGTV